MPCQRLFAISDVHADMEPNRLWLEGLSDQAYQQDALIVAGDVSEDLETIHETLATLVTKFQRVFFTPGNHDLWMEDGAGDSMDKLHEILRLCERIGVATRPERFGCHDGPAVWVCPLLSWHHQSFDPEPDLQGWSIPTAEQCMTDYRACSFGGMPMQDDSIARAVDALNVAQGADPDDAQMARRPPTEPLVTSVRRHTCTGLSALALRH